MNDPLSLSSWRGVPDAAPAAPATEALASRRRGSLRIKHGLDRLAAGLLILFLSPALLTLYVLVRTTSPGPALFTQPRYGQDGRIFRILKFRTMRLDACDEACARQAGIDDPRVTAVGRFLRISTLDELPQLFNVLAGDMSLVGPRPHAPGMRTEGLSGEEILSTYLQRYAMRPGMTGLAQVRGFRGPTHRREDLVRRVEADLEYIATWSLARDAAILARTPLALLFPPRSELPVAAVAPPATPALARAAAPPQIDPAFGSAGREAPAFRPAPSFRSAALDVGPRGVVPLELSPSEPHPSGP